MSGIIGSAGSKSGVIGKIAQRNAAKIVMASHSNISSGYVNFNSWQNKGDNVTVSGAELSGFDNGFYLFHCT